MTCNVCNIQYVGETCNNMNNRCRGHEHSIRTEKDHPVAIHCRSYNHTLDDNSITKVDKEPDKNRRLRLKESWITLLDTLTPKGLNGNPKWNTHKSKAVHHKLEITKLNWNDTFLHTNHDSGKLTTKQSSRERLRKFRLLHHSNQNKVNFTTFHPKNQYNDGGNYYQFNEWYDNITSKP